MSISEPRDRFFYPTLTLMIDSYYIYGDFFYCDDDDVVSAIYIRMQ